MLSFAQVNPSHPSHLHELPVPSLSFICLWVYTSRILENYFKSSTVIPRSSQVVGRRVCWSRVESGSTVRSESVRVVHGEAVTGSIILGVELNKANQGAQGLSMSGGTEVGAPSEILT